MEKEIDLRRLVIKAFHITEVEEGGENKVTASGKMTIEKKILDEILPKYPQLSKLDVQIIRPGEHDRYTNTMMDIIPISTKVLGKIGDGITHTLTGVYVILTGVDETTVAALPYHFAFLGKYAGSLYILDEPSIGLHQRDNLRLINSLKKLRDTGNSVIVVEHDKDMMLAADYVVDMGPKAGRLGGEVVFQGTPKQMLQTETLTSKYLNGQMKIEIPAERRPGNGKSLWLRGAKGNNLKNVDVEFPLGKLICVTGVSGSGKSTLINDTLQPILSQHFYRSLQEPLPYDSVEGLDYIDKVVNVDQSPLGRTPRSNPATYTGVFSDIRNLFVGLPEAKIRGYKPGRFSFNVTGGRCEACGGNGYKTIEMNFLPDVLVPCEVCHGKRYNRETLEVKYKEKTISDVLNMTVEEAVVFFANQPKIARKLQTLLDVGLGYVTLGQSATTLSGGEAQRVKLANELARRSKGKTVYILDEPTTGLHMADVHRLIEVLQKLVDAGNTVIVIEHNLDLIKCADHIIDLGPEGGSAGGLIVAEGTPEQVAEVPGSFTGQYLKPLLEKDAKLRAEGK